MRLLRGFTLIELLVTITIISILVSIIYVSFGDARVNARNKAMTVEIKELQLALETYQSQNGFYPQPEGGCSPASTDSLNVSADPWIARTDHGPGYCQRLYIDSVNFVLEFTPKLPLASDSANPDDCVIEYQTDNGGTWYKLTAINCLAGVDATSGVGVGEPLARCASSCDTGVAPCDPTDPNYYQSFAVYSLGGACR